MLCLIEFDGCFSLGLDAQWIIRRNQMTNQWRYFLRLVITVSFLNLAVAQAQTGSSPLNNSSGQTLRLMPASWALKRSSTHLNFVPTVATGNLSVLGSGTVGRLAKWTGMTSSNAIIGDTAIFENKNGLVGIGTDTPSSKLTV